MARALFLSMFLLASLFSLEVGAQSFIRGDANSDDAVNIVDVCVILDWLFSDGATPGCENAADVNDDEIIDVVDPVYLFNFLFAGGAQPPSPYSQCGTDPTVPVPASLAIPCATAPPCSVPGTLSTTSLDALSIVNGVTTGFTSFPPVTLEVQLKNANDLEGFSLAICVDPSHVSVTDAESVGINPSFEAADFFANGFVLGVLVDPFFSSTIPMKTTPTTVAEFELTPVGPLLSVTSNVTFCDNTLGTPAVNNYLLEDCEAFSPLTTSGTFECKFDCAGAEAEIKNRIAAMRALLPAGCKAHDKKLKNAAAALPGSLPMARGLLTGFAASLNSCGGLTAAQKTALASEANALVDIINDWIANRPC